jgi:hypothetical protein
MSATSGTRTIARTLLALFLSAAFTLPARAQADFTIETIMEIPGKSVKPMVSRLYVQGPRHRLEGDNDGQVSIYLCDVRKVITFSPSSRTFFFYQMDEDGFPVIPGSSPRPRNQPGQKPRWRMEIQTEDTGERATIFGYPARHVRETWNESRITGSGGKTQSIVDYWFIDIDVTHACFSFGFSEMFIPPDGSVQVERRGEVRRGFPVLTRWVHTLGKVRTETVKRVTKIDRGKLPPDLFTVPPGYKPALAEGGKVHMDTPDTAANRMKFAWQRFWEGAAKFLP